MLDFINENHENNLLTKSLNNDTNNNDIML